MNNLVDLLREAQEHNVRGDIVTSQLIADALYEVAVFACKILLVLWLLFVTILNAVVNAAIRRAMSKRSSCQVAAPAAK